ncbi:Protein of uncharacterised function (DUF503) [Aerococcus viridans]|uniref:DUF503 domain-containing protein n=2 Tax=Aerococcus viridans TaxID=1377 RepID=A0AAU8UMS5_9LACT|nr:DUF503 domain-containing protein [Aerococcus viridans]AMC01177.1 hypothetical protein AWM76_06275 [Aerococcus viridans]EFG50068.1 hypothetical protein HMPREF0061_0580 [Aerococcus viridans ATCC 11563 = CCUG 4311]SUU17076.1 Protein of uncharacterised function (DUF503) [Aerococcus viridans]
MILLGLEITFTFASDSLKDKRRILQSMMKKVSAKYGVSVAETGDQDVINQAILGMGIVSNSYAFAEKMLNQAVDFCEANYPIEVLQQDWYE